MGLVALGCSADGDGDAPDGGAEPSGAKAVCGNGVVERSEICDDGVNDGSYNGCMPSCLDHGPRCGDYIKDDGEVCDDGNTDGGDGCNSQCTSDETCGNGFKDPDEVCDDGVNDGSYDGCEPGCRARAPYCGDSVVNGPETCDDGNLVAEDDCNAECTTSEACGNGIVDPGELCDDGQNPPIDFCTNTCLGNRNCPGGITEGSYIIHDESDIERLVGCTEISGHLIVEDTVLTNLDGLNRLQTIRGSLYIGYCEYDRMGWYSTWYEISDRCHGNPALSDVGGLSNLKSVGALKIVNNDVLRNVDGLIGLNRVTGHHVSPLVIVPFFPAAREESRIGHNPLLTNLDGLKNVKSISHELYIDNNQSLADLKGLSNLSEVGALIIDNNPALTDLRGLDGLQRITGATIYVSVATRGDPVIAMMLYDNERPVVNKISNNERLTNVDDLFYLTSIPGPLEIINNVSLSSLKGLSSITEGGDYIYIEDNPELPTCEAVSFLEQLEGFSGVTNICGNLPDTCGSEPCQ